MGFLKGIIVERFMFLKTEERLEFCTLHRGKKWLPML